MRERFILILVGLTVGVLVLYGLPRAYYLANMIKEQEQSEIDKAAIFIASRVDSRLRNGFPVDETAVVDALESTDGARYVSADGTELTVGHFDGDPDDSLVAASDLEEGGTITVSRSQEVVRDRVSDELIPLVFVGLGLAGFATVLAWIIAGRTTRSFRQLAESAREVGRGNFEIDVPERGLPEAVDIGRALKTSAAQLDAMIRRQREFAVNASHQLRTPITAMRLELEDLTYWEETAPEVADQIQRVLEELGRLNATIDEILDLARQQSRERPVELDVSDLLADMVRRWEGRFTDDGRTISHVEAESLLACVPVGPVCQILDVLVENARLHGSGAVTLSSADEGSHFTVRVADEGLRRFDNEVFRRGVSSRLDSDGNGVGLALATDLADAIGGHLRLDESSSHTAFVLMLPHIS